MFRFGNTFCFDIIENSSFHVGWLISAALKHTQSIYSSDIIIYSDINKSSDLDASKSTIRCRKNKTSAAFKYFDLNLNSLLH